MMGAGNVRLVYVYWRDLPGGPFRLLAYMALRALDNDPSPLFWAGREELAFALGRRVPPVTDDMSKRIRNKHFKAVKDATSILLDRGAVSVAERPAPGRNAVYALHLAATTGHGNRTSNGARKPSTTGHGFRRQRGTVFVDTGHENRAPEEEKEDPGLSEGGESEGDHQAAGVAHTHASEQNDHQWTGEFDYRTASQYLLEKLSDEQRFAVDAQARTDLPDAQREEQIIHAAELAYKGPPA